MLDPSSWCCSLCKIDQVDVTLQGKTVTSTMQYYGYKSFIQCLLKYGSSSKASQLSTQLWIKDRAGHLDDNDVKTGANPALYDKCLFF